MYTPDISLQFRTHFVFNPSNRNISLSIYWSEGDSTILVVLLNIVS